MQLEMAAFGEQVQVERAERGCEGVGVGDEHRGMTRVLDLQLVREGKRRLGEPSFEQAGSDLGQLDVLLAARGCDGRGAGTQRPDDDPVAVHVRAQHGMRIRVLAREEALELRASRHRSARSR